jgi:hypothetical protein
MNTPLRADLPPLPERLRHLPIDARGYPVPWFVATVDGAPDHRIADERRRGDAIRHKRCWICGEPLGRWLSFVLGPMCCLTRTTSEPPAHRDCANYAVAACPFLTRPHMHRRAAGMPDEARPAPGLSIDRNPGAVCIWTCADFSLMEAHGAPGARPGFLFSVGEPHSLTFWSGGRAATLAEVEDSVLSGLPLLIDKAPAYPGGAAAALAELDLMVRRLVRILEREWPTMIGADFIARARRVTVDALAAATVPPTEAA